MVGWMDDWMHGLANVGVGCLLAVAWAYGRLIHARGPTAYRLTGFCPTPEAQQVYYLQTTNTHIHPTMHPTIHPFNHPSVHSPTHPSIPSIHSPTLSFIHPSVHPPIRSSTHPFIHPSILSIHSFILATLHPPTPPSTHVQPDTAYMNPPHLSKGQTHRHQPHASIETQCNQTL